MIKKNLTKICMGIGFLLGMVLPCLLYKMKLSILDYTMIYLLVELEKCQFPILDYFYYLLKIRGTFWILWILSSYSIFGEPLSICVLIGTGIYIGGVLTLPIIQLGSLGCLFGILLLFPQYFFYFIGYQKMADHIIKISKMFWQKRTIRRDGIYRETTSILRVLIFLLLGVVSEALINPWVLNWFLKKW